MPLAPLADSADLSARGIDITNTVQIDIALAVASAAIRDAANAAISSTTSTLTFSALRSTFLPLPGPITAVISVTIDGTAVTDYVVDGNGLYRSGGWAGGDISVTFTHGLPTVPDDIVDLACNLAVAWLDHVGEGAGSTAGLTSVRIDDAAETYSDESAGQVSPVYLPEVTRAWLASRFGGGVHVVSFR